MTEASSSADHPPDSSHGVKMGGKTRGHTSAEGSRGPTYRGDDAETETPQNGRQTEDFDSRYLQPSPIKEDDGELIGIDPRKIPTADIKALGHPANFKKAVRMKCLDCVGSETEVRKCVQFSCPLWHMRMGHNPLHGKT